jgi:ATP-dependent Zn protease
MSPRLGQVSLEKDRRGLMLQSPIEPSRASSTASRPRAPSTTRSGASSTSSATRRRDPARRRQVLVRAAQLLLAKETISGQELRDLMAAQEVRARAGLGL